MPKKIQKKLTTEAEEKLVDEAVDQLANLFVQQIDEKVEHPKGE